MDTTVKIDARDVNFWYGDFHALKGISMQIEEKICSRVYRSFRMWKIYFSASFQSYERFDPCHSPDGGNPYRW